MSSKPIDSYNTFSKLAIVPRWNLLVEIVWRLALKTWDHRLESVVWSIIPRTPSQEWTLLSPHVLASPIFLGRLKRKPEMVENFKQESYDSYPWRCLERRVFRLMRILQELELACRNILHVSLSRSTTQLSQNVVGTSTLHLFCPVHRHVFKLAAETDSHSHST
jgi:hypothetical protein